MLRNLSQILKSKISINDIHILMNSCLMKCYSYTIKKKQKYNLGFWFQINPNGIGIDWWFFEKPIRQRRPYLTSIPWELKTRAHIKNFWIFLGIKIFTVRSQFMLFILAQIPYPWKSVSRSMSKNDNFRHFQDRTFPIIKCK